MASPLSVQVLPIHVTYQLGFFTGRSAWRSAAGPPPPHARAMASPKVVHGSYAWRSTSREAGRYMYSRIHDSEPPRPPRCRRAENLDRIFPLFHGLEKILLSESMRATQCREQRRGEAGTVSSRISQAPPPKVCFYKGGPAFERSIPYLVRVGPPAALGPAVAEMSPTKSLGLKSGLGESPPLIQAVNVGPCRQYKPRSISPALARAGYGGQQAQLVSRRQHCAKARRPRGPGRQPRRARGEPLVTYSNFLERLFKPDDDDVPIDPITGEKFISWNPKYKDELDQVELPFHPSLLQNAFIAGKELRRCYKATRDGFSAEEFHARVDNRGPTVVVATAVDPTDAKQELT
eukprot:scaffold7698_cov444-Prasinococcus_capsulatus_cf.AAC.2